MEREREQVPLAWGDYKRVRKRKRERERLSTAEELGARTTIVNRLITISTAVFQPESSSSSSLRHTLVASSTNFNGHFIFGVLGAVHPFNLPPPLQFLHKKFVHALWVHPSRTILGYAWFLFRVWGTCSWTPAVGAGRECDIGIINVVSFIIAIAGVFRFNQKGGRGGLDGRL